MPTTPLHSLTDDGAALRLRVELPEVASAGSVDLNISDDRVELSGGGYELSLALSRLVVGDDAKAKFDKKARVLTLTLPCAAPTPAPVSVVAPTPTAKPPPAKPPAVAPTPSPAAARAPAPAPAPSPAPSTSAAAAAARASQAAVDVEVARSVEWRQTESHVALLVQIADIVKGSVEPAFERTSVRLAFAVAAGKGGGAVARPHVLSLALAGEIDPAECRFDVADRNMMVVLGKAKPPTTWAALERSGGGAAPSASKAARAAAAPARAPAPAPAPAPPATSAATDALLYELD